MRFENPNILGLLPARAGSKGLPNKNLMVIGASPITSWASRALANANGVTKAICSTDSMAIAEAAAAAGLEVPFMRPPELAQDETLVRDVIVHALTALKKTQGLAFEWVVLVQATSPTVTSLDIERALEAALNGRYDTVVSAYKLPSACEPAQYFSKSGDDNSVSNWGWGEQIAESRRQDWPVFYARTGLVYVFRTERLLDGQTFYTGKTGFIEVEPDRAISIDTIDDFERAKNYLETQPAPDF